MQKLYTINNKDIYNINTTILHTSSLNYNLELNNYLTKDCTIISKHSHENINDIPKNILEEFNCQNLKTKDKLTKEEEYKINILANINNRTKIFVFFNILTYLDPNFKTQVINYLKSKHKHIINYTTNIEETLLLDYIIVMHNNILIMEGNTFQILEQEEILKKLGFNLPFIVELSKGLKYYGIVDKIYYTNESLVNDLWN